MTSVINTLVRFWTDLQQGQVAPLGIWSYLLIMVLIVIQGPISTMLGGAAAAAGLLNPVGVFAVAVVGNLGADSFWYSMGYSSKAVWERPLFRRHREVVDAMQADMRQHAVKVLLLAKLSVGMAVPAVIAAGVARVPWRRWVPVVILGEVVFTGLLLTTGYFATQSVIGSEATVVKTGITVSIILFAAMLVYVVRKVRQHRLAG